MKTKFLKSFKNRFNQFIPSKCFLKTRDVWAIDTTQGNPFLKTTLSFYKFISLHNIKKLKKQILCKKQ